MTTIHDTALKLWKMQALGNDFLLGLATDIGNRDWIQLARTVCSRHYGFGADGLLIISGENDNCPSVRMWNPDGTEDFCVNGLRCAARFLHDSGFVSTHFSINAFRRQCRIELLPDSRLSPSITIDIGPPLLLPSLIPVRLNDSISPVLNYPLEVLGRKLSINSVSTGVAHTVIFVSNSLSSEEFLTLSPVIETHPLFPERTCVLWTTVVSTTCLNIRIWERGVGETLGCGSGACAAAVIARLMDLTGDSVTVVSAGGEVRVAFRPGGGVRLTGYAEYVGKAEMNSAGPKYSVPGPPSRAICS